MSWENLMAEVQNPNQQTGAQNPLAIFVLFLIFSLTLIGTQTFKQHKNATHPVVQTTAAAIQAPPASKTGFLSIIAKPLFHTLQWIHLHIVHNWGWSILILTLLINLVLLPLRLHTTRSQMKMQRIQPQIAAIRDHYKGAKMGDPRMAEMNKEIFDLQRQEGVNVFSSILPLLFQMPVLYGFYRMLQNVTELRQADWLWLHNLSAPDPLHILPIFFLATMFVLQFLTPAPGVDPTQRKVMAFMMPLFGCFMTWHAGAGLALYWSFGNVLAIIQQMVINHRERSAKMPEVVPRRNTPNQSNIHREVPGI
jgi:YidC/Oxa1 family membrane protein insertase